MLILAFLFALVASIALHLGEKRVRKKTFVAYSLAALAKLSIYFVVTSAFFLACVAYVESQADTQAALSQLVAVELRVDDFAQFAKLVSVPTAVTIVLLMLVLSLQFRLNMWKAESRRS